MSLSVGEGRIKNLPAETVQLKSYLLHLFIAFLFPPVRAFVFMGDGLLPIMDATGSLHMSDFNLAKIAYIPATGISLQKRDIVTSAFCHH